MHKRNFHVCIILLFILAGYQCAGCEETVNREIDHLLHYIEDSDCTFIRNGEAYDTVEARAHIEKKYDYFKDRIKTTEDFIIHAATKSTMSGKPYKVQCNGKEILCADWLNAELDRFRSSQDYNR